MTSRIPIALQNVFLASQGGENVEKIRAPAKGFGMKTFFSRDSTPSKKKQPLKVARSNPTSLGRKIVDRSNKGVTASEATSVLLKEQTTSKRFLNIDDGAPQYHLDKELQARGYPATRYSTLESGYYCKPNSVQLESFGSKLNEAIRQSDANLLRNLVQKGLSPNACNKFGESIVHSVCRRGDAKLLQTLIESGCSVQVSDDYGRTPLHDACWQSSNPCFETVRLIMQIDPNLYFMRDIRGATPLMYVRRENYDVWVDFLSSVMEEFWPAKMENMNNDDGSSSSSSQPPPPLVLQAPNSCPLANRRCDLPLDVIGMVANGQLEFEAIAIEKESEHSECDYGYGYGYGDGDDDDKAGDTEMETYYSGSEIDDDSFYDSDDDSYDSDDFGMDEGDISDMLMIANFRR